MMMGSPTWSCFNLDRDIFLPCLRFQLCPHLVPLELRVYTLHVIISHHKLTLGFTIDSLTEDLALSGLK